MPLRSARRCPAMTRFVPPVCAGSLERRNAWRRAYRNGEMVCGRVQLAVGGDPRLGLTHQEQRRCVAARFVEHLHPDLRDELAAVARHRGAAARRPAERIDPIEVVFDDERQRLIAQVQPPQRQHGALPDLEFGLRELS